jgi:hypothetical protein
LISISSKMTGLPSPSRHHCTLCRRSFAVTPSIALALAPSIAWWPSGTVDAGHGNKYATVCSMRLSTRRPIPDMFGKISGRWYSTFNKHALCIIYFFFMVVLAPHQSWAGRQCPRNIVGVS